MFLNKAYSDMFICVLFFLGFVDEFCRWFNEKKEENEIVEERLEEDH